MKSKSVYVCVLLLCIEHCAQLVVAEEDFCSHILLTKKHNNSAHLT